MSGPIEESDRLEINLSKLSHCWQCGKNFQEPPGVEYYELAHHQSDADVMFGGEVRFCGAKCLVAYVKAHIEPDIGD